MLIDNIKINPKLLKPLEQTLNLMEEEKRMQYIDNLLADVDQTIKENRYKIQIKKY